MREDGLVFGYLETEDFGAVLAGMADREANERCQTEMAPLLARLAGQHPDQSMIRVLRTPFSELQCGRLNWDDGF